MGAYLRLGTPFLSRRRLGLGCLACGGLPRDSLYS